MKTQCSGKYNESPNPGDKHIVNYLRYIGSTIGRFRRTHPDKTCRTTEGFATNILSKYRDSVSRRLITRLEDGENGIAWGIVAACLYEMGVIPELIAILERGQTPTLHYMQLVHRELAPEIREAHALASKRAQQKALLEKTQIT